MFTLISMYVSHPPEEYVKSSSWEYFQQDDDYQDANELVQGGKEWADVSHVSLPLIKPVKKSSNVS